MPKNLPAIRSDPDPSNRFSRTDPTPHWRKYVGFGLQGGVDRPLRALVITLLQNYV
jgi:hypothetical protein